MAQDLSDRDRSDLARIRQQIEEATKHHDLFRERVERRYRAYRGFTERLSEARTWRSQKFPPYVLQIIETMVANTLEDKLRFKVRPRPFQAPAQILAQRQKGARSLEIGLGYYHDIDRIDMKQRDFALQNFIAGLTVGKSFWAFDQGEVTRREKRERLFLDAMGTVKETSLEPVSKNEVLVDHPSFEVVDVRDFLWHEAARDIEDARWVAHRVWMDPEALDRMVKDGVFRKDVSIQEIKQNNPGTGEDLSHRELAMHERDRTKDKIEVIEFWTDEGVWTIANMETLLKVRKNPFEHQRKPFFICSSMPELFQIPGISEVEIMAELQDLLWDLMNQRIDNVKLLNNAITILRGDIDDVDQLEFAPGEFWPVEDVSQVQPWTPNPLPAEISVAAEAQIKGDLQNITGGMPFVSGVDQQIDQTTATGVSIVTTIAQRRLQAKKQQFMWAWRRKAELDIAMMQQFIRRPELIQIIGPDAEPSFFNLDPEKIQGRYLVDVEQSNESIMRQERRAEAQAKVQMFAQLQPLMVAMQQPLNPQPFIEDWLRAYDVDDVERYFSNKQPALPPGGGGAPPGIGTPAASTGGGPGGVTNPGQAAGPTSPSNAVSLSPEQFMQRAGAMRGRG